MKKILIFLVLLAALLFATNPNKRDFADWTQERMKDKLAESAENQGIQQALSGTLSELGSVIGSMMTSERDYYLFSLYTVDLGEKEYKYLGIFKTFVPLQTENPLEGKGKKDD